MTSHDTTSAPPGSEASWYDQGTAGQAAWRYNCRIPSENNIHCRSGKKLFSFRGQIFKNIMRHTGTFFLIERGIIQFYNMKVKIHVNMAIKSINMPALKLIDAALSDL